VARFPRLGAFWFGRIGDVRIDNRGTDKTLYDIGPCAWGDGKVDIEDLKVFIAQWEKANPPAQP